MKNLTWLGKAFLWFMLAITIVDLAALAYSFSVVSNSIDETLNSIAAIVAEENCIDTSTRLAEVKELMVGNCPLNLTYNAGGIRTIKDGSGTPVGYAPGKPTSLQQDIIPGGATNSMSYAVGNIDMDGSQYGGIPSIELISSDGKNCWSYETCPQRGQNITVKLTGYYTLRMMWPWAINANATDVSERTAGGWYLNIPVTREVTVVGMKFYKGKEGG